ncbi:helix-turn-helix transcriptional regulator [Gordonia otitidis]|uniref:LuxR family transcriptional regulator n=1 Tax=Gordonia otitidis (strain DSM 44809 / CCUG 52243 / JCM 12355 / NBRC 100426 / IFM 10032) TaxID=1108044 RepID=H5TNK0_GORO1|nr:helix-turn-helix transcriptional regulator [Gordonia otitidis]GAB35058.1 putative LuxR family transcriptional regulator [Gordonia otitidis NBRC 100426]
MTAPTAPRIPAVQLDTYAARRRVEAVARRQEALARLAARRMPLPAPAGAVAVGAGPLPGASAPGGRSGRHMHLLPGFDSAPDEMQTSEAETRRGRSDLPKPQLTPREIEVLRTWLMVDTKPATAEALYISLGTVNTHLTRIRAKYAEIGRPAPTKAGLVARAVQDGIVELDEL